MYCDFRKTRHLPPPHPEFPFEDNGKWTIVDDDGNIIWVGNNLESAVSQYDKMYDRWLFRTMAQVKAEL